MLKIGLVAHVESTLFSSPCKILYTWDEVEKHNKQPNAIPIKHEQWMLARLLERNNLLEKDIKSFQSRFGQATTEEEKIKAVIPSHLANYKGMKHYLQVHNFSRKILYQGKEMGGDDRLLLFYANVLNTQPNGLFPWTDRSITCEMPAINNNAVYLRIRYADVTKNAIITYIKRNWENIYSSMQSLPTSEKYLISERDLRIVELRDDDKEKYQSIADEIADTFTDQQDIDEASAKVAYQRAKKRISLLYVKHKSTTKKTKKRTKK